MDIENKGLYKIIDDLIGKQVTVLAHYAISGKLLAHNHYVLHIYDDTDNTNWFVKSSSVEAIVENKKWPTTNN